MINKLANKFTAAITATALSPVFAAVALAVRYDLGSPIIYKQKRYGKDGAPFNIYKFRTMRAPQVHETSQNYDSLRVTRLGKFLRRTGLDELPQFWNIMKGEMNLIGPRPRPDNTPQKLREIYKYTPGIMSPSTPTPYRRATPNQHDYEDRLANKLTIEIMHMRNRSLIKDLRLFFNSAVSIITHDQSGATETPPQCKNKSPALKPKEPD